MRTFDNIMKNAKRFGLVAKRIDGNKIQLYSPKYQFDSWLIVRNERKKSNVDLLHMSKRLSSNKCTYHLQKSVHHTNWVWLLQGIVEHSEYVVTMKWNARENKVDRLLRENKERLECLKKQK